MFADQRGPQCIKTGGMRERKPKIIQTTRSGMSHLAHFSQLILASPSTPIVTPEVGSTGFMYSAS